ncbi:MAG TPA: hypothetical protein VM869_30520 [Enhygromyxa sp.]|nr:hypothetical protein [Enhygromyxa sp.]
MFDEVSSTGPKLPLTDLEANAIQRLGRWMRVVGTIQLALSGMALLLLLLAFSCGFVAGDMGAAMLVPVVLLAMVSVALMQGLRIQAAGEQFKNLAEEREIDYLEIAFTRLKTVFVVDVVIGVLLGVLVVGGSL